jgi:hypothetical protein
VVLTYNGGTNFTGFDPNPANVAFPFSFAGGVALPPPSTFVTPASLGEGGHQSMPRGS